MEIKEEITSVIKNRLLEPEKLDVFTDIRKTPSIPLRTIITCLCLMPLFGIKSLLRLDFLCRKKFFRRLFGSPKREHDLVCSDSTFQRVLRWLDPRETERFQLSLLDHYHRQSVGKKPLMHGGRPRSLGVIDGSCMGGHYLCALALHGELSYPVLIQGCSGRGRELEAGKVLIRKASSSLGELKPELLLLDSLYFTRTIFQLAHTNGFHVLIKSSDPEFRTVLQDAKFRFSLGPQSVQKVDRSGGYDALRLCSWSLETTSESFAGLPVRVAHLVESFSKNPEDPPHQAWIVTTDLSLLPEELREAAYARWSIENDVFKKLSHLTATKRFHFKDQKPFLALLRLLCVAVTAFELALFILSLSKELFKVFRGGIKPTLFGLFSRLTEYLEEGAFA